MNDRTTYIRGYMAKYQRQPHIKLRDRARRIARKARADGLLVAQPCEKCGSPEVQMHHEDHTKPLVVCWFCRRCHDLIHKIELLRKITEGLLPHQGTTKAPNGKWHGRTRHAGKKLHLGTFDIREDAAKAVRDAIQRCIALYEKEIAREQSQSKTIQAARPAR